MNECSPCTRRWRRSLFTQEGRSIVVVLIGGLVAVEVGEPRALLSAELDGRRWDGCALWVVGEKKVVEKRVDLTRKCRVRYLSKKGWSARDSPQ